MTGKIYSIHTRTTKKNTRIFYAQFKLDDGSWSGARSSGLPDNGTKAARSRAESWATNEAVKMAEEKKQAEIDSMKKAEELKLAEVAEKTARTEKTLQDYSENFFSWGGRWAENKLASGKRISEYHCLQRADLLKNHLVPNLGHIKLADFDQEIIEDFRNAQLKKYSGSTVNKMLSALKAILKAATKSKLINGVPDFELAGLNATRRGKLTRDEARKLFFSGSWIDRRSQTACYLAAKTGMRISEIQGLQLEDIFPGMIEYEIKKIYCMRTRQIRNTTKSGKSRITPLAADVVEMLVKLAEQNPFKAEGGKAFLFYGKYPAAPIAQAHILRPYYIALESIGITEKIRTNRNICFHSFRYFANSFLRDSGAERETVREALGHAGEEMGQNYYRADDQRDKIRQLQAEMFSDVELSVLKNQIQH